MSKNHQSTSAWGANQTQHFFNLNPDAILSALEAESYACTGRCFALNSFENRVYEIELEKDASMVGPLDHKKVVKFYRPGRWTQEQILDEHAFLLDLQNNEIPVVAPEVFKDDSTLKQNDQGIYFAVFPKIGGRLLDEASEQDMEQIGRLLARLHNVGASQKALHRMTINEQSYGLNHLEYLCQTWPLFPKHHKQIFTELVQSIASKAQTLFTQFKAIRLHGDCHFGNILKNQEQIFFVDFDDSVNGPEIQDIWLAARLQTEKPFSENNFNALIEDYEQIRPFDMQQMQLIPILRALRMIHFCAWKAHRWDDPSFPKAFPEFNSDKYWNELLGDLNHIAHNIA